MVLSGEAEGWGEDDDDGSDGEEEEFDECCELERAVLFGERGWATLGRLEAEDLVASMRGADEDDVEGAMRMMIDEDERRVCLTVGGALSAESCAKLRARADEGVSGCETVDAMDGEREDQVLLSREEVEGLIGKEETERLWGLPQQLEEVRPGGQPTLPPVFLATVSLRRYGGGGRTRLGLHVDSDHCTVNVCLNPPSWHQGGDLLVALGGGLRACARGEGDAVVHAGEVAHCVTGVASGARYSMLLFFNRPGFLFQQSGGRFRRPAKAPS